MCLINKKKLFNNISLKLKIFQYLIYLCPTLDKPNYSWVCFYLVKLFRCKAIFGLILNYKVLLVMIAVVTVYIV